MEVPHRNRPESSISPSASLDAFNQELLDTGSAVPVDVGGTETVVIGGEEFRPSSGVQVVVEVSSPEQFCAQAVNEYGDRSSRWCYDPADPPTDPDRNAGGVTP